MDKKETKDITAFVRAKLKNIAKSGGYIRMKDIKKGAF
jgi:hypothetical protein